MSKTKLILLCLIAGIVVLFFLFDLNEYLRLETIKTHQSTINQFYSTHTFTAVILFSAFYVIYTSLSLPGAVLLTLTSGAVFGILWGTVIASCASTLGAVVAFLLSRYVFYNFVQKRYPERMQKINEGVKRDGAFYLFALRLVPIFPYFVINVLMGLTPIRVFTYAWTSQLGMLPATFVYVYAGKQLAEIDSVRDILSIDIAIAFSLIGLLPLITRLLLKKFRPGPLRQEDATEQNLK